MRKADTWSSAKLSFDIPREAALQLQQLASTSDVALRELGILSVQLDNEPLATINYPQSKKAHSSVRRAVNGHVERHHLPNDGSTAIHASLKHNRKTDGHPPVVGTLNNTQIISSQKFSKHKLDPTTAHLAQKKPRRVRKPKDLPPASKSAIIPVESSISTMTTAATTAATLPNHLSTPSLVRANRLSVVEPSFPKDASASGQCPMIINPYTGQLEPDPSVSQNSSAGKGLQVLKGLTPSELKPGTPASLLGKPTSLDHCSSDLKRGLDPPGGTVKNGLVHKKTSDFVTSSSMPRITCDSSLKQYSHAFSPQRADTQSTHTHQDERLSPTKLTSASVVTSSNSTTDSVLSPANLTQMVIRCSQYASLDITEAKKQRLLELNARQIGAGSPVTEEDGISPSLAAVIDSCGSADSDDVANPAVLSSPSSSADDASHFSSPRTDPLLGDSSASLRNNPVVTMQSPDHSDFSEMPQEKGTARFLPSLHDNVVKRQMVSVKPVSPVAKYSMEC